MAEAQFFIPVPAKGVILTIHGFEMSKETTRTVGENLLVLLAAGGPHPPLDQIVGPRAKLLARQAELRACWKIMRWGK